MPDAVALYDLDESTLYRYRTHAERFDGPWLNLETVDQSDFFCRRILQGFDYTIAPEFRTSPPDTLNYLGGPRTRGRARETARGRASHTQGGRKASSSSGRHERTGCVIQTSNSSKAQTFGSVNQKNRTKTAKEANHETVRLHLCFPSTSTPSCCTPVGVSTYVSLHDRISIYGSPIHCLWIGLHASSNCLLPPFPSLQEIRIRGRRTGLLS